jgi:putative DNA primase/helicase
MKKITGTTEITARYIAQNSVTFPATHSQFVTSNHRPMVDQTDHGTWRRLALVRFPFTFSGSAADPNLRDRIKRNTTVRQAVLAWIVEGAMRWYALGQATPEAPQQVLDDTDDWRSGSDLVLAYWRDRLTADRDSHVLATDLYADFSEWLQARGQREWADRTFVERFGEHEETERVAIERRRIRPRGGLSRRSRHLQTAVEGQYTAWLGVRFRTPADVQEQPAVQGVQAFSDGPRKESLTREALREPTHPAQDPDPDSVKAA